MGCFNVTTNAGGVPYLTSTNVTVSDTTVDIALGWSRRQIEIGRASCRERV